MKATDSLPFGSKSAIQLWLGLLLAPAGQQKGALNKYLARRLRSVSVVVRMSGA